MEKENNKIVNIISKEGQLTVSSRDIASNFEKEHKDVLEKIDGLIKDLGVAENSASLFIESEYQHEQNKQFYKEYLITRDGFSLLVMGFTGKRALQWKLKYIEAFNKMEEKLKEKPKQLKQKESLETVNESVKILTPILERAGIDGDIQLLTTVELYKKAGVNIPVEIEAKGKYYTSEEIASEVKLYSKNNKPHAQAVGIIISKLDIADDEKKETLGGKGAWQGAVTKYTQSVIEKVLKWLIDNEYPSKIESKTKDKKGKEKTKNFHVVYKHEEVASC